MKKWNYQTHRYDDYTVPEDWKVSMYETDMEKEIDEVRRKPYLAENLW